jgi:hypothetical protein
MEELELSLHALEQSRRRHLSEADLLFVVQHAHRERQTGVIFFQLLRKNIPLELPANDRRRKLEGTTVVTCKCGQFVITAYKNKDAFKEDRKKSKYAHRGYISTCPCCGQAVSRSKIS